MKSTAFLDVIPCRLVEVYKYFGGTCYLFNGLKNKTIKQSKSP
jgi:hypothetical protein